MKNLEDKIAEVEDATRIKIEALVHEDTVKREVKDLLKISDINFAPGFIHTQVDCWIQFTADDLSKAIELAERMNPLSIVKHKHTFTSFIPWKSDQDQDTHELINPYIYNIKTQEGYPTEKFLVFYVDAGKYRVEVRVKVLDDKTVYVNHGLRERAHGHVRGERREYFCTLVNNSGHFHKSVKWYSTHNTPSDYTLYF